MPLTKDVSKNISVLTKENKNRDKKRPRDQIIAIAMNAAGKSNGKNKSRPPKRRP